MTSPYEPSPLSSSFQADHGVPSPTRSIRDSLDSTPAHVEDGDTFYEKLSILVDQSVNSMSISPSSRDVALGARKGLFIVDLQNPYDPPRFLPHHSAWEVADVQWNPFPSRSEWVASTSNQKAIVYNLGLSPSLSVSPIEHTLHAHTRAVTDINWSPGSPEVLATCALDGWVWSWDLRTGFGTRSGAGGGRKPVWGVCSWGSGATQVKWNRREAHIIASAHGNRVLIWDDRFGATPVTTIEGHDAKIYGIDWSRQDSNKIVSCSLDKTFKSWNIKDTSAPDLTVSTSSPVWRARYTPFGLGVTTLPQRSDDAVSIWSRAKVEAEKVATPVARFVTANAGVKEFVWRTRGGSDEDNDDRQFQLVTWAKDRRLRLWPVNEEITAAVGHVKGAPIKIPMTRRDSPDVSYRTFAETPAVPSLPLAFPTTPVALLPRHLGPPTTSLLTASIQPASPAGPSLLTSSLRSSAGFAAPVPFAPLPPPDLRRGGAATMTTALVRNRRQRAHDRLVWMEGVRVIREPSDATETGYQGGQIHSGQESRVETRASSVQRGTDSGTAREGGETERGDSVATGSKATTTTPGKEGVHANLGEEITAVVRRFKRINFEKVHIAGRTCTVSLYSPMFLRATFTFPKNYPASSPPTIEIERTADISPKSRAFLLQSTRKLMAHRSHRGIPSFEQALRFLLGDRTDLDVKPQAIDDEDDEDGGSDDGEGRAMGVGGLAAEILRNNINTPLPRRSGATFGPSGQLVVFFPTDFAAPTMDLPATTLVEDPTPRRGLPVRLSEAFGNLSSADRDGLEDDEYQETDEALQMTSGISFQSAAILHRPLLVVPSAPEAPTFGSVVHIKDVSYLAMLKPTRMTCSLAGPPLDVAREALVSATAAKDLLLVSIWTTLVCFFENGGPVMLDRTMSQSLADKLLPELVSFLIHLKDVQTLGMIACLLESYRRMIFDDPSILTAPTKSHTVDYFSHRAPVSDPDNVQTPTASGYRLPRDSSNSPKASWTNLAGLFNSSVLSLRSQGTSSTQVTPEVSPTAPTAPPESPGWRRPGVSRTQSKLRDRGSPNVTFGVPSVTVIDGKSSLPPLASKGTRRVVIAFTDVRAPVPNSTAFWWSSERAQIELELFRIAYAELLCRWRLDHARIEVLKLCRSPSKPGFGSFGTDLVRAGNGYDPQMGRGCYLCGSPLRKPYLSCQTCHRRQKATIPCTFCHLPVRHLSVSCSTCLHVGHETCLQRWYDEHDSCPTGCGCLCVSSGGTSGVFATAPSRPAPTPAEKVSGAKKWAFFG